MAIAIFHDVLFPEDISEGATGGPEFSTDVVVVKSGAEQRNINWMESRCRYSVGHGVKDQAQLDKLIAFFRCRRGRACAFRFRDPSDHICDINHGRAVPVALSEGSLATIFQIQKHYYVENGDGFTFVRTISKPVAGTVKVYVNGVLRNDVTIDYNTGRVMFAGAVDTSTTIVGVECIFDVGVRFDTDSMQVSFQNFQLYDWNNITLIEVRG